MALVFLTRNVLVQSLKNSIVINNQLLATLNCQLLNLDSSKASNFSNNNRFDNNFVRFEHGFTN